MKFVIYCVAFLETLWYKILKRGVVPCWGTLTGIRKGRVMLKMRLLLVLAMVVFGALWYASCGLLYGAHIDFVGAFILNCVLALGTAVSCGVLLSTARGIEVLPDSTLRITDECPLHHLNNSFGSVSLCGAYWMTQGAVMVFVIFPSVILSGVGTLIYLIYENWSVAYPWVFFVAGAWGCSYAVRRLCRKLDILSWSMNRAVADRYSELSHEIDRASKFALDFSFVSAIFVALPIYVGSFYDKPWWLSIGYALIIASPAPVAFLGISRVEGLVHKVFVKMETPTVRAYRKISDTAVAQAISGGVGVIYSKAKPLMCPILNFQKKEEK